MKEMLKENHFEINNGKIFLYTTAELGAPITREFTEFKVEKDEDGFYYSFEILPNMCFALRALIAKYKVFTAEREVLIQLVQKTNYATMPILSLSETGKHVLITCPPLNYYLEFISAVGAASKGMNRYTVPIARAFDVIRAAKNPHYYLPGFMVSKDLNEAIKDNISGFDGSIHSLFETEISELKSVANAYRVPVENFKAMEYNSIADFLVTQPRRYIDKTKITNFEDIQPKEQIIFIGEIVEKKLVYYKHMNFKIQSNGKIFDCMYYHRAWMSDKFALGDEVLMIGDYQGNYKVTGVSLESLVEAKSLDIVPIYPQSAKYKITSKILLNVVYEAMERIKPHTSKMAPYINKEKMEMTLDKAIHEMHFPTSSESYIHALETLALYELVYLQLLIKDRKANEVKDRGVPKPYRADGYFDAMKNSLPWDLTDAQKSGLKQIDKFMSSPTSEQILLTADVGSGKGLLEEEQIATPYGWRKMKDLKVGDYITGRNGKPTKVIGVYPQGEQEVAKITFKDGVEIITDMEHRWTVMNAGQYPEKYPSGKVPEYVISTKDLLSKEKKTMQIPLKDENGEIIQTITRDIQTHYKNSRGLSKWKVPLMENPIEFDVNPKLPLDPYILGYWLGDGLSRSLSLVVGYQDKEETIRNIEKCWDGTLEISTNSKNENITLRLKKEGLATINVLKKLNVYRNKHIPLEYMMASAKDRISLLQGLVDSDGSIGKDGSVAFGNTNKVLIDNVIELVQSLGGMSWHGSAKYKKYPYHGEIKTTTVPSWNVVINLPPGIQPSRLKRKLERYKSFDEPKKGSQKLTKTIKKVEKLDYKMKTICIKVDAEDENFITKGYTVTHNTVIGQLACMQALDNGYQSALAAPTEVLAVQLYENFMRGINSMPEDKRPTVAFLGGKTKAKEKKEILKYVKSGDINILIGTHSVLSNKIEYKNLGLVVVDEQQKFGKAQREALLDARSDGFKPDILAQTATPIPRSTAQAFYGDINMISLNGKPEGRIEIITKWIKENPKMVTKDKENPMWKDIMNEVDKGHQVFVVVPMVYESLKMDSASVEGAYKDLKKILPKAKIGFTHGSLKKDDQHSAMEAFRNKETNILVASTVIEVGVDVPNATRIVILSADRMGASSLHQIRGRVGRSNLESICYLVSEGKSPTSKRRLQALVDSSDGFEIAKIDLETRGEGDLFGEKQAGDSSLRFSSLVNHGKLINQAQLLAEEIYNSKYRDLAIKDAKAILGNEED